MTIAPTMLPNGGLSIGAGATIPPAPGGFGEVLGVVTGPSAAGAVSSAPPSGASVLPAANGIGMDALLSTFLPGSLGTLSADADPVAGLVAVASPVTVPVSPGANVIDAILNPASPVVPASTVTTPGQTKPATGAGTIEPSVRSSIPTDLPVATDGPAATDLPPATAAATSGTPVSAGKATATTDLSAAEAPSPAVTEHDAAPPPPENLTYAPEPQSAIASAAVDVVATTGSTDAVGITDMEPRVAEKSVTASAQLSSSSALMIPIPLAGTDTAVPSVDTPLSNGVHTAPIDKTSTALSGLAKVSEHPGTAETGSAGNTATAFADHLGSQSGQVDGAAPALRQDAASTAGATVALPVTHKGSETAPPLASIHDSTVLSSQPVRTTHEGNVQIARRTIDGGSELTVRLNPVEMGRVEVRMAFDEAGGMRALVAAERPAVLELLRRDSADLGRALSEAGVKADGQTFRFDSRTGNRDGGHQPQHGGSQHDHPRQTPRSFAYSDLSDNEHTYRALRTSGRIDLMA